MKTTAGFPQPVDQGHVPFASSVALSLVLHGIVILWMLGSAWLLSRGQPYRLPPQTVYLVGDSPIAIDRVLGEGGGASGAKQESKEPGGAKAAQVGAGAEPSVEKFAPPVEKPVPPPPRPVMEKAVSAPPPRPVVEKAAPSPPKPVVEKPAPPTPAPKPVVEKVLPPPPKPPPEAMTVTQKEKETKPSAPKAPPTPTPPVAQQKVTKPQKPQDNEEETAEAVRQRLARLREETAQKEAAQQRVASIRSDLDEQQAAQKSVAALRARIGSGGSGEGTGSPGGSGSSGSGPGSGTAGTGSGGGTPGGGRGTGAAGAGGVGTGVLVGYQAKLQAKITKAWNIPPQSKDLQADVFLIINRAGNVEQVRLVQGSGNTLFDESLQRAITQAQPLPALPEDYAEPSLRIKLHFRGRG